ncbi:hypothetical protein CIL03_14480 [Virgibacillus indicus]|uniref:PucR C-terminal helix-turn-helix domain-containing protein n=1 Tax=Virgibacillus indicus TaxID=2024554 RepID=A0A265N7V9_9BACI|nr:helix-turn-helix domain-containing protein [Virgibacillus indicus]OZU87905.1 hypothetical protein CIL03_14480 [Virgibacillus indicus]
MIQQLKKIFNSLIRYDEENNVLSDNYQWFLTGENEVIGIDKKELTEKDVSILSSFLSPYNINLPILTKEEQQWKQLIHSGGQLAYFNAETAFRFVHFTFKKNELEPITFKEAVHEFFSKPVPILWENEHEGIIIEEQSPQLDEGISYEQIIDVLMSDLYVKINFFVGPFFNEQENIKQHYELIITTAPIVFSYSDKPVISYIDAVPSMLIDRTEPAFRNELIRVILGDLALDEELLHTIQTFMQCNLNISVTAKELYMHRNSLHYRLDKFNEKTGIDVRQFHEAMTVYLALLSNMHKED